MVSRPIEGSGSSRAGGGFSRHLLRRAAVALATLVALALLLAEVSPAETGTVVVDQAAAADGDTVGSTAPPAPAPAEPAPPAPAPVEQPPPAPAPVDESTGSPPVQADTPPAETPPAETQPSGTAPEPTPNESANVAPEGNPSEPAADPAVQPDTTVRLEDTDATATDQRATGALVDDGKSSQAVQPPAVVETKAVPEPTPDTARPIAVAVATQAPETPSVTPPVDPEVAPAPAATPDLAAGTPVDDVVPAASSTDGYVPPAEVYDKSGGPSIVLLPTAAGRVASGVDLVSLAGPRGRGLVTPPGAGWVDTGGGTVYAGVVDQPRRPSLGPMPVASATDEQSKFAGGADAKRSTSLPRPDPVPIPDPPVPAAGGSGAASGGAGGVSGIALLAALMGALALATPGLGRRLCPQVAKWRPMLLFSSAAQPG